MDATLIVYDEDCYQNDESEQCTNGSDLDCRLSNLEIYMSMCTKAATGKAADVQRYRAEHLQGRFGESSKGVPSEGLLRGSVAADVDSSHRMDEMDETHCPEPGTALGWNDQDHVP